MLLWVDDKEGLSLLLKIVGGSCAAVIAVLSRLGGHKLLSAMSSWHAQPGFYILSSKCYHLFVVSARASVLDHFLWSS